MAQLEVGAKTGVGRGVGLSPVLTARRLQLSQDAREDRVVVRSEVLTKRAYALELADFRGLVNAAIPVDERIQAAYRMTVDSGHDKLPGGGHVAARWWSWDLSDTSSVCFAASRGSGPYWGAVDGADAPTPRRDTVKSAEEIMNMLEGILGRLTSQNFLQGRKRSFEGRCALGFATKALAASASVDSATVGLLDRGAPVPPVLS